MSLSGSGPPLGVPQPEELEISLFGPGYGECIVLHLGDGRWMIVDSCVDARSGRPAALDYLEAIGVDPAAQVAVILATHWHDDHVRGLADVLRACERARFMCSNAFHADEFLTLIESQAIGTARLSPGAREFADVLSVLRERRSAGSVVDGAKRFVLEGALVHRSPRCEVLALSPSSASVEHAVKAIARLLPSHLQPHLRVPAPKQNAASVALWVNGISGTALLGADLEWHENDDRGWGAVLALAPEGIAGLVKVPHHGGASAHDERMWSVLLAPEPAAMLTPWRRGGRELPTDEDRHRICGLTPDAVIAGRASSKPRRYETAVERTLNEVAASRRTVGDRVGHVRARCAPVDAGGWRVEAIHNAERLCAT